MNQKKRILFLCIANSCRSQIGEGLVRHYLGNYYDVESAGNVETFVHPNAIVVMREIGIDITGHRSKSVAEFNGQEFDLVITVCDDKENLCPNWIGAGKKVHIGFPDPVSVRGSEEEIMDAFRKTRDDMKEKILNYLKPR